LREPLLLNKALVVVVERPIRVAVREVAAQGKEDTMPDLGTLFLSFLRLGLTAFGGPVMVAYIEELSVKRNKWLDGETFKNGVALCQSIPGATAMQTAAYVGLRARGIPGALLSYIGFGLPAFILMLVLSSLYVAASGLPWIMSLFNGLQVIVVAIVANATYSFGRGALKGYRDIGIAAASAVAFWLGVSPFYVIVGAAIAGIVLMRVQASPGAQSIDQLNPIMVKHILMLFLVIFTGVTCLYFANKKLFELSLLMFKIDLFAFGGGFSSLPLMLQEVVNTRSWMDSKTFMDGIALGQVTPGPIVITATFIGYLLYGFFGALVATVAIFTPSFALLLVGTLFFDKLRGSQLFARAVKGILVSFVGLLFYVTIKFAFAVPWDIIRVLIVAASFIALLKKIDIIYIVLIGAIVSILTFR